MDTTKPSSSFSYSTTALASLLAQPDKPLIIDVRKRAAFLQSPVMLPGALRREPGEVSDWAKALPVGRTVVVYCVHGHEVSQTVAQVLRQQGLNVHYLEGGVQGWLDQGLPVFQKAVGAATRWVTRERPKIDRVACPWLVSRIVDADAQFLYVPVERVRAVAVNQTAMAYDVNAGVADTTFTHVGACCSFDAFVAIYGLGQDAALTRLAHIVRGADTDALELAPECAGLLAVSLGMSARLTDDGALLAALLPVYDALYAWCQTVVAGQGETHNWTPT